MPLFYWMKKAKEKSVWQYGVDWNLCDTSNTRLSKRQRYNLTEGSRSKMKTLLHLGGCLSGTDLFLFAHHKPPRHSDTHTHNTQHTTHNTQHTLRSAGCHNVRAESRWSRRKEFTLLLIPVGKFFSEFDPALAFEEQRAAVKHPENNWGFGGLLKDTSACS